MSAILMLLPTSRKSRPRRLAIWQPCFPAPSPPSATWYSYLLYAPCVAVLGAINKEAGWHWTLLVFGWSTGLAYITATVIYQIGTFFVNPLFSSLWIIGMLTILIVFILNLKRLSVKWCQRTSFQPFNCSGREILQESVEQDAGIPC